MPEVCWKSIEAALSFQEALKRGVRAAGDQ